MCSSVADGFDGIRIRLAHHDVERIAVSRAPIPALLAYLKGMGGAFRGHRRWAAISTSISAFRSLRRVSRAERTTFDQLKPNTLEAYASGRSSLHERIRAR